MFPVKHWVSATGKFPVVSEGDMLRKSINESSEQLAGCLGRYPTARSARTDPRGGRSAMSVPTAPPFSMKSSLVRRGVKNPRQDSAEAVGSRTNCSAALSHCLAMIRPSGKKVSDLHQLDSGGAGGFIQITIQCRYGQSVTDRQFQVSRIVAGQPVPFRHRPNGYKHFGPTQIFHFDG